MSWTDFVRAVAMVFCAAIFLVAGSPAEAQGNRLKAGVEAGKAGVEAGVEALKTGIEALTRLTTSDLEAPPVRVEDVEALTRLTTSDFEAPPVRVEDVEALTRLTTSDFEAPPIWVADDPPVRVEDVEALTRLTTSDLEASPVRVADDYSDRDATEAGVEALKAGVEAGVEALKTGVEALTRLTTSDLEAPPVWVADDPPVQAANDYGDHDTAQPEETPFVDSMPRMVNPVQALNSRPMPEQEKAVTDACKGGKEGWLFVENTIKSIASKRYHWHSRNSNIVRFTLSPEALTQEGLIAFFKLCSKIMMGEVKNVWAAVSQSILNRVIDHIDKEEKKEELAQTLQWQAELNRNETGAQAKPEQAGNEMRMQKKPDGPQMKVDISSTSLNPTPEESCMSREWCGIIDKLPPRLHEIARLHYMEDMDAKEIIDRLHYMEDMEGMDAEEIAHKERLLINKIYVYMTRMRIELRKYATTKEFALSWIEDYK